MMARLTAGIRARLESEGGAALVWVAGSMVALLAVSALAVDLGWYYLNASRLQRAADSAALAGVVSLPTYPAQAEVDARDAAAANSFGSATFVGTALSNNRYQVDLTIDVPTFFATIVGIDKLPITRRATAEYVDPVVMGSPANCFGVGRASILSGAPFSAAAANQCASSALNFWAAIHNPYSQKQSGDPYSTRCRTMSGSSCVLTNSEFRTSGYYYGVETEQAGGTLDIWMYDAGFYHRDSFDEATGDTNNVSPTPAPGNGSRTIFELFAPDTTPRDPTDNTAIPGCRRSIDAELSAATYKDKWVKLCTVPNLGGSYVLNVRTAGSGGASNQYALLAEASGTDARVYAIRDMSMFTNLPSGSAQVFLAEVSEAYAGKSLELRFFDPGESDQTSYMTVRMPDGSIPHCRWRATDPSGNQAAQGNGPCRIQTTSGSNALFNEHWITAEIQIPDAASYTCGSSCFWTMDIDLNNAHDRTTWSAWANGNPVRLVPNA